jgi:hypothetical protein
MPKAFKLRVESLTVQIFAVGLAIIGIMLGCYSLGLFGTASFAPYLVAVIMFIYGGACLSESIWEEGIKELKDLTPLNVAGIVLGALAIGVGIVTLPFIGITLTATTVGERLMGALSILFFALSIFLILELFE